MKLLLILLLLSLLIQLVVVVKGLTTGIPAPAPWRIRAAAATTTTKLFQTPQEEAERWLEKSRALRDEIAISESEKAGKKQATSGSASSTKPTTPIVDTPTNKWAVPTPLSSSEQQQQDQGFAEYRLYVDIGREPGTWMPPTWAASGRRIEFTLDVRFCTRQQPLPSSDDASQKMVQDNRRGKSSPTFALQSAPYARLRQGFDQLPFFGGAYRIDYNTKAARQQSDTLRCYVETQGTSSDSNYGDVSIPPGGLYFSIPCFGGSVQQLSTKGDLPVTIRQRGWNTGWWREESRIVGVCKAVPIDQARKKDGF